MRYACNVEGQCIGSEKGEYGTREECLSQCTPFPLSRDVADIVYQYEPFAALLLSPSDQVRIIKKLTGVKVEKNEAVEVLQVLDAEQEEGPVAIALTPILWEYGKSKYEEEEWIDALHDAGTAEAVKELQSLNIPLDNKRIFMTAMRKGDCSTAVMTGDIELEDEDLKELEDTSYTCVFSYLLTTYGNDYYSAENYFMRGAARAENEEDALRLLQLIYSSSSPLNYSILLESAQEEGGDDFVQWVRDLGYKL